MLANPQAYRAIRQTARETIVEKYDLATVCLPRWFRLLGLGES